MLLLGLEFSHLLQRGARRGLLLLELVLLSGLIIATRDAKHADVFVNGQVYFVDADCYSRMTRAREVWEHPGLVVRQHPFENFPAGIIPHTTAPLDYLIVALAASLGAFSAQPLDLMMTDHVMPGMTGIELATASREVRPSLPILLATGYAELPEGAQVDLPRLAKPYHQDQLRDRLDQLLG